MSQILKLTPELIGRAIDKTAMNTALAFIIAVAAAGFFFDSFDIVIVSYALPVIKQEFALDPKQLGLIGSAALAGMGVGSWIWGWVADKWGRRVVFALTVLTFSVCTGIAGLSMSLGFLIAARFMTGLGLTGVIIWWPKRGQWKRAFQVKFSGGLLRDQLYGQSVRGALGGGRAVRVPACAIGVQTECCTAAGRWAWRLSCEPLPEGGASGAHLSGKARGAGPGG